MISLLLPIIVKFAITIWLGIRVLRFFGIGNHGMGGGMGGGFGAVFGKSRAPNDTNQPTGQYDPRDEYWKEHDFQERQNNAREMPRELPREYEDSY